MLQRALWNIQLQDPSSARRKVPHPRHRTVCASNNGPAMGIGSQDLAVPPQEPPAASVRQPGQRAFATMLVHSEDYINDPYNATMPPLYQTATFRQPGPLDMGEYDYTRSGNPTRTVLERQIADLEVGALWCRHSRAAAGGACGGSWPAVLDWGARMYCGVCGASGPPLA